MKRNKSHRRRGVVLICVLACLAVSTVLIALSIQSALRSRREVRLHLQLRQTELLCEAGVLRATKKLRDDAAYPGEQWNPQLASETYHSPNVLIEVVPNQANSNISDYGNNDSAAAVTVTVTAKLDSHLDHDGPMQRSHLFNWQSLEPSKPAKPTEVTDPSKSPESPSSTLSETPK